MHGAANVSLSPEKIADILVPCPATIEEQGALIDDLERVASKIDELQAQTKELQDDLADELSIFQKAFE